MQRNIFLYLFLLCGFFLNAQNIVRSYVNENHFISFIQYQFYNINKQLIDNLKQNKLAAYDDENCKTKLPVEELKERLRGIPQTIEIQIDPNDPYALKDSTVYMNTPSEDLVGSNEFVIINDTARVCGLFSDSNLANYYNFRIYIKWNDAKKLLKTEQQIGANSILNCVKKKNKTHYMFGKYFYYSFGNEIYKRIDDKIYNATKNAVVTVYMNDSLTIKYIKNKYSNIVDHEESIQIQVDPNDPYNVKDSVVYVHDNHNDTSAHFNISTNIKFDKETYNVAAVSSMYVPYAGGIVVPNAAIGYIKQSDWKVFLSTSENAMLEQVIKYSVLTKLDFRNFLGNIFSDLNVEDLEKTVLYFDEESKTFFATERYKK